MKKKTYAFYSILIAYILFFIFAFLYFKFLYKYISIPECPIHMYLGFFCPACGCTRALISLINLDFTQSFLYNPIILYTLFISSIFLVIEFINMLLNKKLTLPWKFFIFFGIVILITNCILQNTILHIL